LIAKTYTCSLLGIDALLVEVEVDLASGLPGFSIVRAYLTWLISRVQAGITGFHHTWADGIASTAIIIPYGAPAPRTNRTLKM